MLIHNPSHLMLLSHAALNPVNTFLKEIHAAAPLYLAAIKDTTPPISPQRVLF